MTGRRMFGAWLLAAAMLSAGGWEEASAQARGPLRRVQNKAVKRQGPSRQGIVPQARRRPTAQKRSNTRNVPNVNGELLRLMQMPAEARRKHFQTNARFKRLPAARKKAIQARLAELDKLPSEQKELLVQRYQLFSRLPREQQATARRLYGQWLKLPRSRRTRLGAALRRMRQAEPAERERMLGSERFEELFGEEERRLIGDILALTPR